VRPRSAQVVQQVGVPAAVRLQRRRQFRQALEGTLLVDVAGEGDQVLAIESALIYSGATWT